MKLLIYTGEATERVTYTFDFVLGDLLGLAYILTRDKELFTAHTGPKFSYTSKPVADELFLECAPLLFESDINLQPVDFIEYEDMIGFYSVSKRSDLPFDMFATTFAMLSRYNEYLIHKKDKYDRYRASQSPNFIAGFLGKPMINYYGLKLKKMLSAKFPELKFKENKFEYIATFDVDMAYAYRGRGFNAHITGFVKSFLTSSFKDFGSRFNVIFRNKKDPYDTFDYLLGTCKKYAVKTKTFFLVGNTSSLDKNISHAHEGFRNIIKNTSAQSDTGIHLSFMSHISNEEMEEEIRRLEYITGLKITSNRFNYLRFTMPASFVSLTRIGITDDYSMGYATPRRFQGGYLHPILFLQPA